MDCENYSNCNNHKNNNLFQNVFTHQTQIQIADPATISNSFLTEYYKHTSLIGWNFVQNLFDHKCVVMLQDKNLGNEYDLLNFLSSNYIKSANYDNLRPKWVVINNTTLLVSVFGNIQFVSFNGDISNVIPFSESFVLTLSSNNNHNTVCCTHHILDL